jgi:hypothetical protein
MASLAGGLPARGEPANSLAPLLVRIIITAINLDGTPLAGTSSDETMFDRRRA